MPLRIIKSHEFDPKSVTFSGMKKGKIGNKTVYLQSGGKKIYLQLPFLRSPYGLSSYTDDSSGKTTWSLDLSLDSENDDAQALRATLMELDDLIVKEVAKNSEEWLGKTFNEDVVKQALYKPIVRPGKDDYADTLKLKITTNPDGSFVPETFNMSRENVELTSIEKGQKCLAIVDVASCWVIDNKIGVTCRLQQVLLDRSERLPSFAFEDVPGLAPAPEKSTAAAVGDFVDDEDLIDE